MLFSARRVTTTCNSTVEAFSVNGNVYNAEIYEKHCHGVVAKSCNIKLNDVELCSMDFDDDIGEWVGTDDQNQLVFCSEQDALTAAAKIMSKLNGD